MAGDAKRGTLLWKLRRIRWHQWARAVAAILLFDQALGTITGIPTSEAIIVACIGALFAPVPVERRDHDR